jgi:hypothetical protein
MVARSKSTLAVGLDVTEHMDDIGWQHGRRRQSRAVRGFIQKTKPGGSESVNCGLSGVDNNDIHIVLAGAKQAAECSSITAEMIPHLRPTSWNRTALNKIQRPVRIRGQLFFDASHLPCSGGAPVGSNPKRLSNWEIHPVY